MSSTTKVVAFGGGHGLYASLQALRVLNCDVTAVVTVADDGGSSGRLRQEFDSLPPGDLRQALVALTPEDCSDIARLWQHRFAGDGPLSGHAVGNLILAGLFEQYDDPVQALDRARTMIKARGRVLPMTASPLEIEADVDGIGVVRGQVEIATTPGRVRRVRLVPADPPAVPQALAAIEEADWILFGPGSWFTSVVPHLLVPELSAAIHASSARRIVVLNLATDKETAGFSGVEHLEALLQHDRNFRCDIILADSSMNGDHAEVARTAESIGGCVVVGAIAEARGVARHNPVAMAAALEEHLRSPAHT